MEKNGKEDATDTGYCVVITTFSDAKIGQTIIDGLLNQHLAACIQTSEINSCYRWKGAINRDKETLLLIKTRADLYGKIEKFIKDNHSYEIPEIIKVPINAGLPAYLNWIDSECGR
jgi:periplasmic divalent cation tolerance protein